MSICPRCYVQGVVDGVVHMPADDRVRIEMRLDPVSDGEVVGERMLVLEAEIGTGSTDRGEFSARGVLVGNFGISPEDKLELGATVEAFAREGSVAFVQVSVERGDGAVSFAANLRPAGGDGAFRGLAFLGWPDSAQSSSS